FLKNATPQVSITHWRQATLSAASNEASGALSANTNLSRRRIATNSEIWFIISFISSPTQCTNRVLRTGVNSGPACEAERKVALACHHIQSHASKSLCLVTLDEVVGRTPCHGCTHRPRKASTKRGNYRRTTFLLGPPPPQVHP